VFYGNNTNAGELQPSTVVNGDYALTSGRVIYEDKNMKSDSRFFVNCNTSAEVIAKYTYKIIQVTAGSSSPGLWANKYEFAKISNVDHHYNSSNWIIYRLSDIMLLKAEALVEKMDNANDATVNNTLRQQAFSLVNAVNKRSVCQTNLTDTLVYREYNTKAKLQTLVLQERQRELMFEGKRWFDLVRRSLRDGNADYLVSCISQKGLENASLVSNRMKSTKTWPGQIFWPYNLDETKVSEPLAKNQNPAYPSGEDGSIKTSAN
jgi:hypothetical protein